MPARIDPPPSSPVAARLFYTVAVFLAAFLVPVSSLAQNAPRPSAPEMQAEKQFPLGASWVLASLAGKSMSGDRPTLVLDQNLRARGFGSCNTYSVTAYPLRRQGFAVGPIAATKKACAKEAMTLEGNYFLALRTARAWDVIGGQLVLRSPSGELRFERGL
jgi:heat shock protein HslJ